MKKKFIQIVKYNIGIQIDIETDRGGEIEREKKRMRQREKGNLCTNVCKWTEIYKKKDRTNYKGYRLDGVMVENNFC